MSTDGHLQFAPNETHFRLSPFNQNGKSKPVLFQVSTWVAMTAANREGGEVNQAPPFHSIISSWSAGWGGLPSQGSSGSRHLAPPIL